jgi:hypothetical protein
MGKAAFSGKVPASHRIFGQSGIHGVAQMFYGEMVKKLAGTSLGIIIGGPANSMG